MDLGLQYEELKCYSCVLDTVVRREETQESIVSDSMPDIGTVVTASATLFLRSCRTGEGSITCEGDVVASVIYTAEESGGIHAIPVHIPFRCIAEAGNVTDSCRMNVLPRLLGIDVKVMNPRKVLVQAEISVRFLAFHENQTRYTVGVESGETPIQTKTEKLSLQYISQVTEKTFPFEESVSLSGSHRRLEKLLSCDITPYCNESKIVGSKVVFKGGVKARVRALSLEQELVCEEYDLPVSQVLDAGNSGESALSMVSLSATDLQVELDGEEELRFNMELYACGVLVDSQEADVLCDAYSTACPCQCGEEREEQFRILEQNTLVHPFRQAMDLELPSAEVLDQVVTLNEVSGGGENGYRCRLKVSVCLKERDGHLSKNDQSCYVDLPLPQIQADRVMLEVKLLDGACISAAGGVELRGSLLVHYAMLSTSALHYVSTLVLDEAEEDSSPKPSAVLRMLREGETLWDLGKEYYATVEDILAVNQISDESAAGGRFLLIPRNR